MCLPQTGPAPSARRGPRRAMGHTSGILPMPRARPPAAFNLAGERVGVAPVPVAVAAYGWVETGAGDRAIAVTAEFRRGMNI